MNISLEVEIGILITLFILAVLIVSWWMEKGRHNGSR